MHFFLDSWLLAKIKELTDFEIKSGLFDLGLSNPQKDDVLAFYSMVGNIFLFLGFTIQFAGTALVLRMTWKQQALIVGGGFFWCHLYSFGFSESIALRLGLKKFESFVKISFESLH